MIPDQAEKYAWLLRIVIAFIVILFVAGVLFTNYLIQQESSLDTQIYPNIYIDNLAVGRKTRQQAQQMIDKKYSALNKVKVTVLFKEQPIATFSASDLGLRINAEETVNKAYLIGRTSDLSARLWQKSSTIFNWGKFNLDTSLVYNKSDVNDWLDQTKQHYNIPAKNALFEFANGKVTSFRPEENGTQIKTEQFKQDLEKALFGLKDAPQSKQIILQETVLKPEITLAKANQFGIEEEIGEGQSNYSRSAPERIHNIVLAASRINGTLVPKGQEFSFNATVGEISKSTGYDEAYIIQNGKTVLGDGGGVCQVSTTLFRSALNSGLPITARTAHAYRVGYYENDSKPGFDATVFSPYVDFRFKNNTGAAILIQTEIDQANSILRFKFYGKKDGRTVSISNVRLWDVQPPPPASYQDDPTLPKGTIKQVDFAAYGGKADFDYTVTLNGQTIFQKEFYSVYKPWQAVFLVGQG